MARDAEKRALGQRLYAMRTERHMTQEELAEKLDIDSRSVSRYENGEVEMGALLYERVLALFHRERLGMPDAWNLLNDGNRRKAEEIIRALYLAQCYEEAK